LPIIEENVGIGREFHEDPVHLREKPGGKTAQRLHDVHEPRPDSSRLVEPSGTLW